MSNQLEGLQVSKNYKIGANVSSLDELITLFHQKKAVYFTPYKRYTSIWYLIRRNNILNLENFINLKYIYKLERYESETTS